MKNPLTYGIGVGYVVRWLSGVESDWHRFGRHPVTGEPVNERTHEFNPRFLVRNNPTRGLAVGGGASLIVGPFRIAPGVHYTRWSARPIEEQGSRGSFVDSAKNQIELLLGVTF